MVIDAFDVSPQGTHVGVIYYSDKAHMVFDFNRFQGGELTARNVVKEIRKINPTDGKTRIDLALEMADTELFSKKGGVRMGNPKVFY